MSAAPETVSGPLITADGIPLKESLQKSLRRSKIRAALLVAPPLLFLIFLFVIPIGNMLTRSVDDKLINQVLPNTFEAFESWDKVSEPDESMFEAIYQDLKAADKTDIGKASVRMNYAKPGWRSLIKRTARRIKKMEPPYKEAFLKADDRWTDNEYWLSLGIMKDKRTLGYYLNAVDRTYDFDKNVIHVDEERKVYNLLWWRTIQVSIIVTLACLLLAYPVAYLLATLPMRIANLLMICVLMPFWTSLLVRIVAWMIMLQQNGVVNDTLVAAGILSDENRLAMMYNFNGTVIVMTQILLPFMILPIFSVMKTIPPSYMKAAQNLGATPTLAFIRVYMPQTIPGIGAGCILVFIVAIGYYITPELVGGKDGRLIGNMVAYHMQRSLNWGLAAAMGTILLIVILIFYWIYDKIIGIDNMKMG
ncbi:MAG: ABC transporter permease subunit [Gammaproteobacteria bacterium]|jgi:putative spermidine/putrescine transport system permease protein|nr:ABC transporter permease subunit [Gammaproteobacteria bacterium]